MCFVLVWVWLYLVLGGCLFVVCAAVSRCVWIVICYSWWFGVGWFTGWFVGGVVVFVVGWFLVSLFVISVLFDFDLLVVGVWFVALLMFVVVVVAVALWWFWFVCWFTVCMVFSIILLVFLVCVWFGFGWFW